MLSGAFDVSDGGTPGRGSHAGVSSIRHATPSRVGRPRAIPDGPLACDPRLT